MINKEKTDKELGEKIREHLALLGVDTPIAQECKASPSAKRKVIEEHMMCILRELGLDMTDDSLRETPRRVAKMYVDELFPGLDYNNFPKITTIENKMQYNTMLLERNISVKSVCEHHILPFIGSAFVAYIPHGKVIGLSKINRIVEFFSRRPQVQERLTEQIFHTLCYILGTEDVAVVIRAEHSCVKLRGVEDFNSDTLTARLGGAFTAEESLRDEFYKTIKL